MNIPACLSSVDSPYFLGGQEGSPPASVYELCARAIEIAGMGVEIEFPRGIPLPFFRCSRLACCPEMYGGNPVTNSLEETTGPSAFNFIICRQNCLICSMDRFDQRDLYLKMSVSRKCLVSRR